MKKIKKFSDFITENKNYKLNEFLIYDENLFKKPQKYQKSIEDHTTSLETWIKHSINVNRQNTKVSLETFLNSPSVIQDYFYFNNGEIE